MTETNWAGNHVFRARTIHEPTALAEAQEIVAAASEIRAVGSRHSFNGIADGDEMISLRGVGDSVRIDESAMTVTVNPAVPFGHVAGALHARGFALHNLGSLPHITVGGAVSTGTHGSGNGNGVLATAVVGVEFIGPDGDIRSIDRSDDAFAGSVVALGALGIMSSVTLSIEPSFDIVQRIYGGLRWDDFLDRLESVTQSAYSVSVMGKWASDALDYVWCKYRIDAASTEDVSGDNPLGLAEVDESDHIRRESRDGNITPIGIRGPWSTNLAHFRFDRAPSAAGDEIQSEFFVERSRAADALRAVRRLAERIDPLLIASEFRTAAADDLWLSPAYRRDVLGIHFTWRKEPAAVAALLPAIQEELAPFDARPHWGKLFSGQVDLTQYERASEFLELARSVDPGGKFWNAYLREQFV